MRCSICHHSYKYEVQTSWLVFENQCGCECHTYPGRYPKAIPGSFPDDEFVTVPLDEKANSEGQKVLADRRRRQAQEAKERAAEERARAAWDSQEPMPEEQPKTVRIRAPYVDSPPFNRSTVFVRRQTNSLPHLTEYRRSGFETRGYVNQLPYRRVPNWSRDSRCTDRRKTGLEKLRERSSQLRALQRGAQNGRMV
ncbi:uncharacterized protein LDX57_006677 [Aspergillus melleus]|uniref:uncharacterized protein n=1 Tax=Aspergillus melleus TaxID=138277 RepID=UPI001E8ED483|nr:uncharacterized protein LDX57_006677 [Aspergillus melleus]KAH8429006.1 hypothetical protein LDX57_006677 [Aspergillus melleus]